MSYCLHYGGAKYTIPDRHKSASEIGMRVFCRLGKRTGTFSLGLCLPEKTDNLWGFIVALFSSFMRDPDLKKDVGPDPGRNDDEEFIEASWKPFYWFLGSFVAMFVLGELLIDFGLHFFEFLFEVLEKIWLVLIEAPEEWLEDQLADYLKQHFPHEAERYSEIATALGLTPLKLFLLLVLGRYGLRRLRDEYWPRLCRWFRIRVKQVHLAWDALTLVQKIISGAVFIVLLVILI